MKTSIHKLLFRAIVLLADVFIFIDFRLGIDTNGLMIALDWPFWMLDFWKYGEIPLYLNAYPLPEAWYWAEVNAELSHSERPWAILYASQNISG